MRRRVESALGREQKVTGEPAFAFITRLSGLGYESKRDPQARPARDQIDVSGWSVRTGAGVEPRVATRFGEYLKVAMNAPPSAGGPVIALETTSGVENGFVVDASPKSVRVTAANAEALQQAIYWLQDEMESFGGPWLNPGRTERKSVWDPRYLYSYFALYGDPLLEPGIDPFPEGYLEKLARVGINGVWMQCVLNNMAPSKAFPEFGHRADERIRNLNLLIERARKSGMRVFLYLNEPRAMPPEFFRHRPEIRGAGFHGVNAMCTTAPLVRAWISDSLAYLFERAPQLGGVFTISMSENLTNCFSKYHPETCPRCSKRTDAEVVGEVLEAIRSGVRRVSKTAQVIHWDWGWPPEMCRSLIPKLPTDVRFSSVSEWSTPIERGGVRTEIGEYSISVVGPGPRARENWRLAAKAGVRPIAKTQFNNTWEISATPYIPVPPLVARHCANLKRAGITGIQASWTLGGYPSPNLEVAKEFYFSAAADPDDVLSRVAVRRYGHAAAQVLRAWAAFSQAFELYPYSVAIYTIPTQHGPANLLRAKATGVRSSMILFPQDDYKSWSGKYSPEVVQREFTRMSDIWGEALPDFRKAIADVPEAKKRLAVEDLAIAETCYIHFRSTANQIAFYVLRDGPRTAEATSRMRDICKQEMELARMLYSISKRQSVIGYEASNHYYYRPADLAEKILNCRYILDNDLKDPANG